MIAFLLTALPLTIDSSQALDVAPNSQFHRHNKICSIDVRNSRWNRLEEPTFCATYSTRQPSSARPKSMSVAYWLRGCSQRNFGTLSLSSTESSAVIESDDERWRQRGMSAALASTYFAVMGAKCALPSVLTLLTSSKSGLTYSSLPGGKTPQFLFARLLGMSTLAVAFGKIALGPLIDKLGGIQSLQVALTTLSLLVLIISFTQQFSVFAICWILVDFIFSSCWAGCINAIHQSFPEDQWGRQVGLLAAGARIGNATAFAIFALVLYALENRMKQPWRVVFGLSALLQILPISLLTHFGNITLQKGGTHAKEERPSIGTSVATLRREACTLKFWLHLLSRSTLMVFASFLLFVPTLMSQVYGSSNAFAAQTGSIYALGCLLSVTTLSDLYSRMPRKRQALSIMAMLGVATASSLAQLGHVAGRFHVGSIASSALLFLWGWAFSVPFYIPPSLYGKRKFEARISSWQESHSLILLFLFS